ncbi:restriction endonuclease subunit S [Aquimarina latercula]|uniref:restriction endonuclease subunit S n=1 Tax=Aquimarina latercula TaxID=987 RepID=UPI0004289D52|nr:restriction endonuclease subunit S [Aquimarina latercula]
MTETDINNNTALAKEGYKQTKLGWIPKGWSTPTIAEVFEFLKTTSFSRNQLNYDDENNTYYIHYGDIHATYKTPILDLEEVQNVPKLNSNVILPSSVQYLKNGDVIIADASEDYDGVGTAIELQNIAEKSVISGLHTFALRDKAGLTVEGFRTYIFKNPIVKKALKTIATGSKVFGISKGNVQKFKIVLPTLPEQQKIASILNTWDKAIAAQEKLIVQKQELKNGLMQQLLTGKKRFFGYTEEWEEVKLEDVCIVKGKYGIGAAAVQFSNDLPRYLRITDIDDDGNYSPEKEVSVSAKDWKEYVLEDGDIVFARTGNTTGKTYLYQKVDGVLVYAGFLIKFKPIPGKLNANYLKFFTQTKPYWDWVKTMSVRSGQPGINSKEYGRLKLNLPSIKEQSKVVEILSSYDTEIRNIVEYKNALMEQKQGLMQQLLTGQKRVEI